MMDLMIKPSIVQESQKLNLYYQHKNLYSSFTVGAGGDWEPNIDVTISRNLAQELIFNSQRLGASLQAPANSFLVINCFHSLNKLLQPTAARWRGLWVLPCGEPNASSSLGIHGAAWNWSLAKVGEAEKEGEEEEDREEDALHGYRLESNCIDRILCT